MAMRILSVNPTTVADLIELIAKPYPEQRGHEKTAARKTYLHNELKGDQLMFHAVTINELNLTCLIDGYHRVSLLEQGGSTVIPDGATPYLVHHEVDTMDEARFLYGQFNSLSAAKKSNDQFDGGLRAENILDLVGSHLILKGGRATAIQLAYGKVGSKHTTPAVRALKDAILFVDDLDLHAEKHVIGGQLGAYFAIGAELPGQTADRFIRLCNRAKFKPTAIRMSDLEILKYRAFLERRTSSVKTGGNVNNAVFRVMLEAFSRYHMIVSSTDKLATASDIAAAMSAIPGGMQLGTFKTWAAAVRKSI